MHVSLLTVLPRCVSNQFWLRDRNISDRVWGLPCSNFILVILLQTLSSQASLVLPLLPTRGQSPEGPSYPLELQLWCPPWEPWLWQSCHCQSDNWWSELELSRNPNSVQGPLIYPDSVEQTGKGAFDGAWPMSSLQAVPAIHCRHWCPASWPCWKVSIWMFGLVKLSSQECKSWFWEKFL